MYGPMLGIALGKNAVIACADVDAFRRGSPFGRTDIPRRLDSGGPEWQKRVCAGSATMQSEMELIEQLSLLAAEHFKATSALLREGGDTRLLLGRTNVLQVRWENVAEELEEDIKETLLLRQPRAKLGQRLARKDAIAAEVYVRPSPGAHSSVLIFESFDTARSHFGPPHPAWPASSAIPQIGSDALAVSTPTSVRKALRTDS
jgi:hypothetical protein